MEKSPSKGDASHESKRQMESIFEPFIQRVEATLERIILASSLDAPEGKESSQKSRLRKKIEFARRSGIRIIKTVSLLIALGVSLDFLDKKLTEYKVTTIKTGEDITYVHEDPETTEILNYLTGKGELPEASRVKVVKGEIINAGEGMGKYKFPIGFDREGFDTASTLASTKPFFIEYFKSTWANRKLPPAVVDLESFAEEQWGILTDIKAPTYNKKIYEYIWRVENISGNPKIRWLDPRLEASMQGRPMSHFDHLKNTMYIASPANKLSSIRSETAFFAEASHGVQLVNSGHPFIMELRSLKDLISSVSRSLKNRTGLRDEFEKNYSIKGMQENEAHSEIEPRLLKGIPKKDTK